MVDMQGVTGTRQQLFVLPYRKVLHYGIQTAGFGDPLQASQLTSMVIKHLSDSESNHTHSILYPV